MRYSENPNEKAPVVITITGATEYRSYCKQHDKKWYIIDKDCVKYKNRWYYSDINELVYDNETKSITVKHPGIMNGIIEFDEDGFPVLGEFSSNPYFNVSVNTRFGKYPCINYQLLEKAGYVEDLVTGLWHERKTLSLAAFSGLANRQANVNYKNQGYNIEDNAAELVVKSSLYDKFDPYIPKKVKRYAKFLGGISWGQEIEFSKGGLPSYIQNQLGIVNCRDGSTSSGGESVTVPYRGAKGLYSTQQLGIEVAKRMDTDISCSYHIHIGSMNLTRPYLAALWKLGELIQDELFSLFPYYKTDPAGVKQKNYNKKLQSLFPVYKKSLLYPDFQTYTKHAYSQIFKFLSEGEMPSYKCNRKQEVHPIKIKWDRPSRYLWLNLQNGLFSKRKTLEFRLHHGTTNPQKMINWLFMCNAITKYAEKHTSDILLGTKKIKLDDVLNYYAEEFPHSLLATQLSEYLIAYSEERKKTMKLAYSNGDFMGDLEARQDKDYVFTHRGVTHLF